MGHSYREITGEGALARRDALIDRIVKLKFEVLPKTPIEAFMASDISALLKIFGLGGFMDAKIEDVELIECRVAEYKQKSIERSKFP